MSKQTLLFVIFIVIVGATVYLWFNFSRPATAPAVEGSQDFAARLTELRRLKDLRLDTAVLQDSLFRSLEFPQPTPLPEVKIGRFNPFLPF